MYIMDNREVEAVRQVVRSGRLFRYHGGKLGSFTGRFEQALADKLGTRFTVGTSSGTGSLIVALAALGVGPGDEVIVPGYTFIATAVAPVPVGAVPVIADVDESLTLDPADLERKITRHTRAIIPVHMLGLPANLAPILKIAKKHGIPVLEDAAQACGGSYRGRRLGSLGKAGAFSFNHYKIIACGEGGAIATSDKAVFERALIYHDCGCSFFSDSAPTVPFFTGINFRMSEVQSAILSIQIGRLDGILAKLRQRKAAMADALAKSARFRLGPVNDTAGDCATHLAIQFEKASEATAFVAKFGGLGTMFRPFDTGRHVYWAWESILTQRTHHPKLSPWKLSGRKYQYSKDMLPQTRDILGRTVCIPVPLAKSVAEVRKMAKAIV